MNSQGLALFCFEAPLYVNPSQADRCIAPKSLLNPFLKLLNVVRSLAKQQLHPFSQFSRIVVEEHPVVLVTQVLFFILRSTLSYIMFTLT